MADQETKLQKTIRTIAQALADHNGTSMLEGDLKYATQVVSKYEFHRWVLEQKLADINPGTVLLAPGAMPEEIPEDVYDACRASIALSPTQRILQDLNSDD